MHFNSIKNCLLRIFMEKVCPVPTNLSKIFFTTFSNTLLLLQSDLILICILIFKYVTLFYTMFIYVHLETAIFCIKFTKNGTKECFPYYYLNGDICTGIAMPLYSANICIAITIIYFIIINMQDLIYRMSSWILWRWLLLPCPPPTYGCYCAEQCSCSSAWMQRHSNLRNYISFLFC